MEISEEDPERINRALSRMVEQQEAMKTNPVNGDNLGKGGNPGNFEKREKLGNLGNLEKPVKPGNPAGDAKEKGEEDNLKKRQRLEAPLQKSSPNPPLTDRGDTDPVVAQ